MAPHSVQIAQNIPMVNPKSNLQIQGIQSIVKPSWLRFPPAGSHQRTWYLPGRQHFDRSGRSAPHHASNAEGAAGETRTSGSWRLSSAQGLGKSRKNMTPFQIICIFFAYVHTHTQTLERPYVVVGFRTLLSTVIGKIPGKALCCRDRHGWFLA